MIFGDCTDLYLGNFVGKWIVSPDYLGKNSISTHSSKKKKKIKYVTSNAKQCPQCLHGLLHLNENKIYKEIVVNIPIYTSGSWGINEIVSKWERSFC